MEARHLEDMKGILLILEQKNSGLWPDPVIRTLKCLMVNLPLFCHVLVSSVALVEVIAPVFLNGTKFQEVCAEVFYMDHLTFSLVTKFRHTEEGCL